MTLPNPDAIQIALTLSTLAVIWLGWAKVIGPKAKRAWNRGVGFFQAIAGRDPIVDKASGAELSPAVPPIGERLASIDSGLSRLVEVIESTQNAHARIDNHETRITSLEVGTVERIVTKAESAEMWRAVADNKETD